MVHRRWRLAYVLLTLCLFTMGAGVLFAATGGSQENVSNTVGESEAPQAAVFGSTINVVWGERNTTTIAVSQKTNGGTWPSPTAFNTGSQTKNQWPDIAVTTDGTVHMAYAAGDLIYYRSKPNGGTWSNARTVATDSFPNPVRIAAAPNGTLWIIWRDTSGSVIRYRRSTDSGQTWNGGDVATQTGNMFAPDIAVGSDNVPHIVWYLRSVNPNGMAYADWTGSGWNVGKFGNTGYIADPVLVIDSTNTQHVAYRRQSGTDWIIQHATRAPGGAWGGQENIRTTPGDAAYAPGLAVDPNSGVHITWSELNSGGNRDVWYSMKPAGQSFGAPTNVSDNSSGWNSRSIIVITNDAAGIAAHIFYQRGVRGQDIDDVYYRRYTFTAAQPTPVPPTPTPIPPKIGGTLTINGGAAFTNQASVTVSINNTTTTQANVYSLTDGAAPGAPTTAFTDPSLTTSFNLDVSDGRCRAHTIYGRIGNGTVTSLPFSSSIMYDPGVAADVQARNPNSALNRPLNAVGSALTASGDVAYTREQRFNLSITNPPEECSGLKRYALVAKGAPAPASDSPAWKLFPAEGYVSANIQFAAARGEGKYQFDVYAEDNVGHVSQTPFPAEIVYDATAPTVSGASGPLATTSDQPKGGIATIDASALTVTDNTYIDPGSGRQYWGFWAIVKKTDAGEPIQTEWEAKGVIVPGALPASLSWNMAHGLTGGFTPGANYTVYLRYLDGAGNWSATIASQPVQVSQLERFNYLPLVRR